MRYCILLLCLMGICCGQDFSQSYASVQVGYFWASQGKSMSLRMGDTAVNFKVDQSTDSNTLVGVGYYFKNYFCEGIELDYGVNVFYLPRTTVSGVALDDYGIYAYEYHLTHYPVYFIGRGKFILECWPVNVSLDAGFGPNNMRMSHVKGYWNFHGRTKATFSATTGLSFEFCELCDEIACEVGYRFFYLGEGTFKKGEWEFRKKLSTGSCFANTITISLNF